MATLDRNLNTESEQEFHSVWTQLRLEKGPNDDNKLDGKRLRVPRDRNALFAHHRRVMGLARAVEQAKQAGFSHKVADIVFDWYQPCTQPLESLEEVHLNELRINDHNRGTYVVIRTITSAASLGAYLTLVEDERGNTEQLAIHCFNHDHPPNDFLPKGTMLVIKEPYFVNSPKTAFFILVDHISDMWILEPNAEEIPEEWWEPVKAEDKLFDEGSGHLLDRQWHKAIFWLVTPRKDV
jgi:hypothetical protein